MASAAQLRKVIAVKLAAGIDPSEIAKTEDISPSYISNLKEDKAFQALMAEVSGGQTEAMAKRTAMIEDIQDRTIETIYNNLPKFLKSTSDALRLFKAMDDARRPVANEAVQGAVTVVNLPTFIINQMEQPKSIDHKVNENNEVIEVGGRALISQTSKNLLEIVHQRKTMRAINSTLEVPAEVDSVSAVSSAKITLEAENDLPTDLDKW